MLIWLENVIWLRVIIAPYLVDVPTQMILLNVLNALDITDSLFHVVKWPTIHALIHCHISI